MNEERRSVAFIQARMGSSRYPDKVLYEIDGKALLQIQVERLARSRTLADVVVITTGNPNDDRIARFCKEREIACFRGSERDVLDRICPKSIIFYAWKP